MRFNIIHLSLGLASVVYAVPVMHMVQVSTDPVTKREPIPPFWDLFKKPPIVLEYHYIPPSTGEHQQNNKYAGYTDDVVDKILGSRSKRDEDVPFTGDPRQFSFEILTPIQVFSLVCPCTVDVVVEPQQGGAGARATSTFGKRRCDYFIRGVPSLPDGLGPHAKPPTRPASPASDSSHCPASPHSPGQPPSPGPPHSPGSTHPSDSWVFPAIPHFPEPPHFPNFRPFPDFRPFPGLPQFPGSPHPDSHSDSATSALPQSPGAPHPHSDSDSATPASARPGTYRVINKVDSVTLSDNARFHNGNTFYY
ncbi:hypothetical protein GG344DRAFT_78017 [Lentinula edodes]|nr:hypothetical protein GG344DRAFT_78017 [Lentinula edodes]